MSRPLDLLCSKVSLGVSAKKQRKIKLIFIVHRTNIYSLMYKYQISQVFCKQITPLRETVKKKIIYCAINNYFNEQLRTELINYQAVFTRGSRTLLDECDFFATCDIRED